ncbi:MAG: amidohydrolase family protein [Alphaproteobacteria bacterium]|nr:amidohydrolase family protein [Alphaproteobacteria bacterium]
MLRTALALSSAIVATSAVAETERYSVLANGEKVGFVEVEIEGREVDVTYDVKNNGRGPTMRERLVLDDSGLPKEWRLQGTSTFMNPIDEVFLREKNAARWTDGTGDGSMQLNEPSLYIAQEGSPWSLGVYARALLSDEDRSLPALPGGRLMLDVEDPVTLGSQTYRAVSIRGIGLSPDTILLDDEDRMFARLSIGSVVIREGYERHADQLGEIAVQRGADRYAALQDELAHDYGAPVRLRDVRIFDPATVTLGERVSVLFFRDRIAAIEPLESPGTPGEVVIAGEGRTVLPGLHDMHAHVSMQSALLYIASGVTSVRDMGNDNESLLELTRRIDAGEIIGPRIMRSGFIEGRSEYSSRNGFIVDSEEEALDAVRWYAARGYQQVKIYNSMNPDWVPAVAAEAHKLGLGVAGHVPAFSDADGMIAAGYDELTHINQLMLGWVLEPEEDTRTILRLTAMKRSAGLELSEPRVEATLGTIEARDIAIDPTAVTLELLMLSRDGAISPAVASYFDHLPAGLQRSRRQGIARIESEIDDAAYLGAFETIKRLLGEMHRRGITILPGTDDGTGLSVHRELQIYAEAGIPPAEVLHLATLGPEIYMGRDQQLGSVAKGKLADFILVDGDPLEDMTALHRIAMVVKGGSVFYPSEIWAQMGVRPFADAPTVVMPAAAETGVPPGGNDHESHD